MNKKLVSKVAFVAMLAFTLSACQESSVKRDPIAPPVSDNFIPSGHITSKATVEGSVSDSADIPTVVGSSLPTLPPLGSSANSLETYSISAVNVPVNELLFQIAQDAGKDIDIYNGVQGSVTINALNQSLDTILNRISAQAGFIYELKENTILIRPDLPEWRNYKVDYVNVKKTSKESIDMKMSVSSGAVGTQGGGAASSSTKVDSETVHDFWQKLEDNITLLAQLDPNANRVLTPSVQGQNGNTPISLESVSQNTVINAEVGVISVYTTDKQHRAIKNYIDQVTQRSTKQVLIEATVVEVSLSDNYKAGIDWSKFGGGLFFTPTARFSSSGVATAISSAENILDNLKFLQTFGDTKVLSSPKIMAINNQTALLKVVKNLVYFTVEANTTNNEGVSQTTVETEVNTIPVGFTMSVTPFVSDSGLVTLNVRPTITEQIGTKRDPNPNLTIESLIPVIQEKEMSSVLQLRDRQTAIIGGLIQDRNQQGRSGLPWLSDIPVLGDAFSAREDDTSKSELIIFIRPTIIKNPDVDFGDLKQSSRFLKKIETTY